MMDEVSSSTGPRRLSIFSDGRFAELAAGLRLAKNVDAQPRDDAMDSQNAGGGPGRTEPATGLTCSHCHASFTDKEEQRSHYKLDWHRHNLNQSLRGLPSLDREEFDRLNAGDSSTDSDSDSCSFKPTKGHRHPKLFFVTEDNQVVSLYKCVLLTKEDQDATPSNEDLLSMAKNCNQKCKWAIILIGGGHFSAGIFDGVKEVEHKTFHSYTVRSKQGGSQSARDGKSGTSHPKSAGASLRRYNSLQFQQHITKLLAAWRELLATCDAIFLRAVGRNRSILFDGPEGQLRKGDTRLRSIPFPTKRATYKEVKRAHLLLSSIEFHGSVDDYGDSPASWGRQIDHSRSARRNRISRDATRKSPSRPLPELVQRLADESNDDSSDGELIETTQVMNLSGELQEFDDDFPRNKAQKNKRQLKKNKE